MPHGSNVMHVRAGKMQSEDESKQESKRERKALTPNVSEPPMKKLKQMTLPFASTSTSLASSTSSDSETVGLRLTMSHPRLNNLMLLYIHKERTDEINESSITKSFVMENERKRFYFGNMQE